MERLKNFVCRDGFAEVKMCIRDRGKTGLMLHNIFSLFSQVFFPYFSRNF